MQSAVSVEQGIMAATRAPDLTWFPVRFINDIVAGRKSVESFLDQAPEFGFQYVEMHQIFLPDLATVGPIRAKLGQLGLGVSMLTCGPDFTSPYYADRTSQVADMKLRIEIARNVGAPAVRVVPGIARPGVQLEQGIKWVCECLTELADYAQPRNITLCLENHYRDRMWQDDQFDFARYLDVFLQIYDTLLPTPVMINFDTAQAMVMDTDEVALLQHVIGKVRNVHAGDRQRKQRPHVVIGDGMVNWEAIFTTLRAANYDGFISVEDGSSEGDDGLRRGVSFLSGKISRYWNSPSKEAE